MSIYARNDGYKYVIHTEDAEGIASISSTDYGVAYVVIVGHTNSKLDRGWGYDHVLERDAAGNIVAISNECRLDILQNDTLKLKTYSDAERALNAWMASGCPGITFEKVADRKIREGAIREGQKVARISKMMSRGLTVEAMEQLRKELDELILKKQKPVKKTRAKKS